jgi:hypothetical protein
MIKSCLELVMDPSRDIAYLKGAAKFVDCLSEYLWSLFWITRRVFVVNRQLLVRLIAVS